MVLIRTLIYWVTFEDADVAELCSTTVGAPQGKQIVQMLVDGELDAVLGEKSDHPDLKLLFRGCRRATKMMVCKTSGDADHHRRWSVRRVGQASGCGG